MVSYWDDHTLFEQQRKEMKICDASHIKSIGKDNAHDNHHWRPRSPSVSSAEIDTHIPPQSDESKSPKTRRGRVSKNRKKKGDSPSSERKGKKKKGDKSSVKKKRKARKRKNAQSNSDGQDSLDESSASLEEQGRYVALDCEMVGVGPGGYRSALARVSIIDWNCEVLLDTFVKVNEKVSDYRTFVSGVTESDLISDDAIDIETCMELVGDLIDGKILVGHALKNDLRALMVEHPWHQTRDTAKYELFQSKYPSGVPKARKLKELTMERLNRAIQVPGESHSSVEDATAAMDLYKLVRKKWEKAIEWKVNRTNEIELSQSDESFDIAAQ